MPGCYTLKRITAWAVKSGASTRATPIRFHQIHMRIVLVEAAGLWAARLIRADSHGAPAILSPVLIDIFKAQIGFELQRTETKILDLAAWIGVYRL